MAVKCVMKCVGKKAHGEPATSVEVSLMATYTDDHGNRINEEFARYTPSARFDLAIDNPPAAEQFEEGAFYDVVLSKR